MIQGKRGGGKGLRLVRRSYREVERALTVQSPTRENPRVPTASHRIASHHITSHHFSLHIRIKHSTTNEWVNAMLSIHPKASSLNLAMRVRWYERYYTRHAQSPGWCLRGKIAMEELHSSEELTELFRLAVNRRWLTSKMERHSDERSPRAYPQANREPQARALQVEVVPTPNPLNVTILIRAVVGMMRIVVVPTPIKNLTPTTTTIDLLPVP